MKKILNVLCSVAMLFVLGSCDDFLNEVSKSSLTPENSFSSASDWNKAVNSAYAMLQDLYVGKYTITLNEFGTDEVEPFDRSWAAYNELMLYTYSSSHEFFRVHYIWAYDGIKRCNTVIDMPSSAPVSSSDRTMMIAQAKFLRALYYFDLVASYGGVPMWTSASIDRNEISKPRVSADDVYALIVKDMAEAAEILPATWPDSDKGRATSYAANALLGRLYLQWGKPDEALKALNKVIGKFSLYDNYADIFDPAHKNEEIENIFEVQFSHSGKWGLEGSIQSSYWGPRGGGGPTAGGFSWGGFGPTQYLYDSYDKADKRREAFFCTEYMGIAQNPPCIMKYRDEKYGTEIEDDDLNYIMVRYPDVLLMKAEALNDIGDSSNDKYDCLNIVRKRAGLKNITSADNLTKDQFASVVLEERLHELCCEHHRRFDLIRFGKLIDQVKAAHPEINIDSHHNLYPIPQQAIDSNDAMTDADQNPGY